MKQVVIAFDCDGTLITKDSAKNQQIVANEEQRSGLIWLAGMKNTWIIVWSGSGEMWARQVVRELGLTKYVDKIMAKNILGFDENEKPIFDITDKPDIAFDDVHACILGNLNLIVKGL